MIFVSNIKKHWLAIVLAIFIGLITILPTILSIEKIGLSNFRGIYPLISDDEEHYLTLVREVYDGNFTTGNPYIKEYKSMPYTQPLLGASYYALFAKLFHISVPTSAVVNDFILPPISVLLLYSLLFFLTKPSPQAKKISLIFSCLFFIFFLPMFNRLVNPQLGFIFLLAGLYLVWLIVENKHPTKITIKYNILLSIIFGFLVYIYPFYWMTIVVLYGFLTLSQAFVEKDLRYCLKNWLYFFIPAFILSIPFLLNAVKLVHNPLFLEANLRSGFINTHIPGSFIDVGLMFFCFPIVYFLDKLIIGKSWQERKTVFLGYSLILTSIILNWQNIITGKTIQFPQHLYMVAVLSVCIIGTISSIYIWNVIKNKNLSKYSTALFCLVLILITGIFYKQKSYTIFAFNIISSPINIEAVQSIYPVLDWLNKNTGMDSTIYALGNDYSWTIPVYTHDNLYFHGNAGLSLISDIELENRWAILHFFDPVDMEYIKNNERGIWTNKFIEVYQSIESRRKIIELITHKTYPKTGMMDELYVSRALESYNKFKSIGFEKAVKTYSVDYIVLDKSYDQYDSLVLEFKSYKFLTIVQKIGDTLIYKVN